MPQIHPFTCVRHAMPLCARSRVLNQFPWNNYFSLILFKLCRLDVAQLTAKQTIFDASLLLFLFLFLLCFRGSLWNLLHQKTSFAFRTESEQRTLPAMNPTQHPMNNKKKKNTEEKNGDENCEKYTKKNCFEVLFSLSLGATDHHHHLHCLTKQAASRVCVYLCISFDRIFRWKCWEAIK